MNKKDRFVISATVAGVIIMLYLTISSMMYIKCITKSTTEVDMCECQQVYRPWKSNPDCLWQSGLMLLSTDRGPG